jgi:hypothetical protein
MCGFGLHRELQKIANKRGFSMSRHLHPVWAAAISILLATSLISITSAGNAQAAPAQTPTTSAQDKAKTCNNLADKKNLTGSDRRSFVKDCMKKANPQ